MRITVVAVGRLKERFWREAADEYLKRLQGYADVTVIEVADRDPSRLGEKRAITEEGSDVIKALKEGSRIITLEVDGRELSSTAFAQELGELALRGDSDITFVIGGSHGLAAEVSAKAQMRMSLGPMTLPHNMARVVLLEQLYRAFKIQRGEPYHK